MIRINIDRLLNEGEVIQDAMGPGVEWAAGLNACLPK
jgi:hypothetical protein